MKESVKDYYNRIAKGYHRSRFENSYGEFIDQEERPIIEKHLLNSGEKNVDIACGSGRFMMYCSTGIDISEEMLKLSSGKFPNKKFIEADAQNLTLESVYDNAICFHLIMHLEKTSLGKILDNVYEIIKQDGLFIFDVVSKERRRYSKSNQTGWHGGNDYSTEDVLKLLNNKWRLVSHTGILFLPIHRFPSSMRKGVLKIDKLINTTWLKKYSSYKVFVLKKR